MSNLDERGGRCQGIIDIELSWNGLQLFSIDYMCQALPNGDGRISFAEIGASIFLPGHQHYR